MILREDIETLMKRTKQFYKNRRDGSALIQIKDIECIEKPFIKPLNQWEFPDELYEYLDANIERMKYYWKQRQGIEDDIVPCISPWFGIAEHSAFLGGNVDFSQETSWHHPIIHNWSDLSNLELRENNPWFCMIIDGLKYLKEKSAGQYAIKLRGCYGPLDLANALRGNDIFTDFFDNPEQTHKLLDFCTDAVKWSMDNQKKVIGSFFDGVITGMDVWLPGNSMGHLSEDTSSLCSPDNYREFGMPYTTRLLENYQHAFMHTHASGIHNISNIISIDGIDVIEISSDPNSPRAIEVCKKLQDELYGKIVVVNITLDEIKENLDFLKKNRTIIWYYAKDMEDAKEAISLVRSELPVNN